MTLERIYELIDEGIPFCLIGEILDVEDYQTAA